MLRFAALGALCWLSLRAAAGPVLYTLNDQSYEGYWADGGDSARGLVLLLHDWDGLTEYEQRRAQLLADAGYDVFAADLFGAGIRPTEVADRRQHTGELYRDRAKLRALMQAALDAARQQGGDTTNAVAMGYCFGGAAVLELARSGAPLKGFASFHGGLTSPEGQTYAATQGRVMVYHGSADSAITLEQFAALATELEARGVAHEMVTYGGAPHAFTVFDSPRYRESADRQSWASFMAHLNDLLGPAKDPARNGFGAPPSLF